MKSNGIPSDPKDWPEVTGLVYKAKAADKQLDLSNWTKLNELILHGLTDTLEIKLPQGLKKLTLVAPKAQTKTLGQVIAQATELEVLGLKNASLEGFFAIPVLKSLKSLSILSSRLRTLDPRVSQCTHLEALNLAGNQLQELPIELAQLQGLKRLVLDSNQLTVLPSPIFALHNLAHLGIDQNPFTKEEKVRILETFGITPD